MRNLVVLGASALVLAFGVAQASAEPTTEQLQEHLDRMHHGNSTSTYARPARLPRPGSRAELLCLSELAGRRLRPDRRTSRPVIGRSRAGRPRPARG